MYNILVLEGETEVRETFINIIQRNFTKEIGQIRGFERGEQLLSFVEDNKDKAEIIVVGMTQRIYEGVEIAKKIKAFRGDAQIIFMCDSSLYNPIFYDVEHVFCLKKPLDSNLVCKAIIKARKRLDAEGDNFIFVYTKSQVIRVCIKKIVYIEKEKRITHIITEDGQRISYYSTFEELLKQLNKKFYRCHNSYIVNISFVNIIYGTFVVMENGANIPVSRNRAARLKELCLEAYGA